MPHTSSQVVELTGRPGWRLGGGARLPDRPERHLQSAGPEEGRVHSRASRDGELMVGGGSAGSQRSIDLCPLIACRYNAVAVPRSQPPLPSPLTSASRSAVTAGSSSTTGSSAPLR